MRYISTRGGASAEFGDVLLGGPAADGGLYLPDSWPRFSESEIGAFKGLPYAEVAFRVMRPFVAGTFDDAEFRADVDAAYATFAHKDVVPLVAFGPDSFLLELFHGPTFAFKDVAMQLLGRLFARALKKQNRRATVIVATSGDTGSAAIAALRGLRGVDVVVLHPHGRVSEVQRRQMTTVLDANVHNIALEGSFDDTQTIVKALFADTAFATGTQLTAVNSINFARIMAQCVYYFTAAAALGPGRAPNFVVPTGNFGDVFAGEAAARMGLSIERLIVATNANDILARALTPPGVYSAGAARQTLSPSMDIQVASNFERALFEASNRDASWLAAAMATFARTRALDIPAAVFYALTRLYLASSANDDQTREAIADVRDQFGIVIDPHTAVGVAVVQKTLAGRFNGPLVFLATAHPAKFPDAIIQAIGIPPETPPKLAGLMAQEERYTVLPNEVGAVRTFVLERTKIA